MSAAKHTPGPWAVELFDGKRARINSGEWTDLARVVVRMKGDDTDSPDGIANARLISAAPDLLSALEDTLRRVEKSECWWMDTPDRGGMNVDMIRAAIAKAKGGAS